MFEWFKTILILPFNGLIVIPGLILYFTHYKFQMPSLWQVILGVILLILGLSFALWTMILFAKIGKGTAAPWSPPKNLVVEGPYCYVRNPMITAVLTILISESLLLSSMAIFSLVVVFFIINSIYFPLVEEKGLIKRFGDDYILYKNNVPRWIPRLKKWKLPE